MLGPRKSHTGVFTKTPTIDAVPYDMGDVVGGLMKFEEAAGGYCNGVLQSVVVKDASAQGAPLVLLFFREPPVGIPANNAAMALSVADLAKCIGKVEIASADYETVATRAIATVYPGLVISGHQPTTADGQDGNTVTAGDLWMVAVTTGTPTYAVGALTFELGTLQD